MTRGLTALERGRQIAPRSMSAIRNVCVYCGSSDGADARFGEAAEELGRSLAAGGSASSTAAAAKG